MNDESLIHWGIPGMKWGVRRNNRRSVTITEKSKQKIISKRFRPVLAKETTTVKVIRNPHKKELKNFLRNNEKLELEV